ncbi:MAG: SH3-like domain-containing protein [Pseudomonadota bacterium]
MTDLPSVDALPFDPPYPFEAARFSPGDTVTVREGASPGHIRTPWYLRGKTGRIERICGAFPNPEELAYGRDGLPARVLYRVRFSMAEVWVESACPHDTVDAEIFEHWLDPA